MASFRPWGWSPDTGPVGPAGPEGPEGPAGPGAGSYSAVAASDLIPGNLVYVLGNATVELAKADALPQARLFGMSLETVATGFSGDIQTQGQVTLTTVQWDAVTGQTGGLTPGASYWLSHTTAGDMLTPASGSAPFCTFVGKALNSTTLDLDPRRPIKRA